MSTSPSHTQASYRAYDQMDEIVAAYSLTFTPMGDTLLGGYNLVPLFQLANM